MWRLTAARKGRGGDGVGGADEDKRCMTDYCTVEVSTGYIERPSLFFSTLSVQSLRSPA